MINRATPLYISGVAAAIGFRMNLFNIGVEGQYLLAAIFAAFVGGAVALPGVFHIGLILLVAMFVGGMWAGVAGLLYTQRGINEVISTIMLNGACPRPRRRAGQRVAGQRRHRDREGRHRADRRFGHHPEPHLHPRTLRRHPQRPHRRAGDCDCGRYQLPRADQPHRVRLRPAGEWRKPVCSTRRWHSSEAGW